MGTVLDEFERSMNRAAEKAALQALFMPIVKESMSSVGVTRTYQGLEQKIHSIPFVGISSFNLDQYVTDKSIDGIFVMLAKEEANIRKNPAARVIDLLKNVFGSR
jgi:hypothetical protein